LPEGSLGSKIVHLCGGSNTQKKDVASACRKEMIMKRFIAMMSVLTMILFLVPIHASAGKSRFCSGYAKTAVDQYDQAKQHHLPGILPPVWSSNEKAHYNWCLMVSEKVANAENAKRQAYLDRYLSKNSGRNKDKYSRTHENKVLEIKDIRSNKKPLALTAMPRNSAFTKSVRLLMKIHRIVPAKTTPNRFIEIYGEKFGTQVNGCKGYLVQFVNTHPKNYPLRIRYWTDNKITAAIPKNVLAGLYLLKLSRPGGSLAKNSNVTIQITGKPKISKFTFPKNMYYHQFPQGSGLHFQYYDFPLTISWEDENRDLANGKYQLTYNWVSWGGEESTGWKGLKTLNLGNKFAGAKNTVKLPLKIEFGGKGAIKFSFELKDESGNQSNTASGIVNLQGYNPSKVGGVSKVKGTAKKVGEASPAKGIFKKTLFLTQESDPDATFAAVPYSGNIAAIKKAKLKSITNKSPYTMSFDTGFSSRIMAAKCSSDIKVTTEFRLLPNQTHTFSNESLSYGKHFYVCADPASKSETSLKLEYVYEVY